MKRIADQVCEDFRFLPITREAHERAVAVCGEDRWADLSRAAHRFWRAVHRFHYARDDRGAVEEGDMALRLIERMCGA